MKHSLLEKEIAKRIPQAAFDAIQDEATQQLVVASIRQALEAEEELERVRGVNAEALVIQEWQHRIETKRLTTF